MSSKPDTLSQALGIMGITEPKPTLPAVAEEVDEAPTAKNTQITTAQPVNPVDPETKYDIDFARGSIYDLIEKGQTAMTGILEVAREGQSPRAYEVASNLIKTIGDMTDKLVALQKTKAELIGPKKEQPVGGDVHVEKAVFVGSTSDLLKMVRKDSMLKED